jgi:glycosyltransferase involved in cell wall biosynthesis
VIEQLKVVHCAETIKGGIATYLRELLPLQCEAYGPGAVAVVVPASQASELSLIDGVRVFEAPDAGHRIRNAFSVANIVARVCRTEKPFVVHVHSTFAGAVVRPLLALRFGGVKIVYCPHGWAWDRPFSSVSRFLVVTVERALSFLTFRVICISNYEYAAARMVGIAVARLALVRNGIGRNRPAQAGRPIIWPHGRLRVLFVGRLDRQKGADVLCSAIGKLPGEVAAIFAGSAVLADSCSVIFPPNARGLGWVSAEEREDLFASADVVVVPSRWEGFGLIAAEAMRAGLPVIASRVGGLQELVDDDVTGLLVEPGDVDALVSAMRRISDADRSRMGEAARKRFLSLFTMERVFHELNAVYGFPEKRGLEMK